MTKERLNISATSDNAKDHHFILFDAIADKVAADGKASETRAQILVPAAPHEWVLGEKKQALRDGVNEPVGTVYAATFPCDV